MALEVVDLETGKRASAPHGLSFLEGGNLVWERSSAHLLLLGWKYEAHELANHRLHFSWFDVARMRLTPARPIRHPRRLSNDEFELGLAEDKDFGPSVRTLRTSDGRVGVDLDEAFVEMTPGKSTYRVIWDAKVQPEEEPASESLATTVACETPAKRADGRKRVVITPTGGGAITLPSRYGDGCRAEIGPDGRWALVANDEQSHDMLATLDVVALAPELGAHANVRSLEPHLGPYQGLLLRPDGSVVTFAPGVVALWDMAAWLRAE
jgi:hypothetical protein